MALNFEQQNPDDIEKKLREGRRNPDKLSQNLRAWFEQPEVEGSAKIRYEIQDEWQTQTGVERCFRELKKSKDTEHSPMELSFNPKKADERKRLAKQAMHDVRNNFRLMDLENSYDALFEVLWYTQLPCFDVEGVTSDKKDDFGLLKACVWKGTKIPCSLIFKTSPTDQGMCCTFNMEAAESMFEEGPYLDMIRKMQEKDKQLSFSSDKELPQSWARNKEPKSQAGKSKGLTLILDAHSDTVSSSSITEDVDGFFAIVGSPNEFPLTTIQSILVRPGHNNLVAMQARHVLPDADIRAVASKEDRNCIFADEVKLDLHTKYTQRNCILERSMRYVMNSSDPCTPWYFPRTKKSLRICDSFEAFEFRTKMQDVPQDVVKDCLPDCEATDYSVSTSAAPFRRCDHKSLGLSTLCTFEGAINPPIWGQSVIDQYIDELGEVPQYVSKNYSTNIRNFTKPGETSDVFTIMNRKQKTYDAYEKDIGMVSFFFETTTAYEFYRVPKMTWSDFISQLGGMLGLCMGLSLVSIFEFVYWFTWNAAKIYLK